MELEDLKSIWKAGEFKTKDTDEIAAMLRGNSVSIVSKLKKSVWFELVITVLAGVALLIYALTLPSGSLKWTSISILVILVAYSFYYVKKIMLLNRFDSANENLKSNLENLHRNLSGYLKFYKRSYTILFPVYFVLGLIFGAIERGMHEFVDSMMQVTTMLYLLLIAFLFFFTSTWFTNWYLKKLYGNQMDKLQKLLSDLQS